MKVKQRNNLVGLVFVHLLLLAYPLISKTTHVHHREGIHHRLATNICFDQPEDFCAVCDFEFYNFVPAQLNKTSVAQESISLFNALAPEASFVPFLQYFSLRAPPVA